MNGGPIVRLQVEPETDAVGVEQAFYSALEAKRLDAPAQRSLPPAGPADAALIPVPAFARKASIFVSYAHDDERFLDAFRKHLATFERIDMATVWHDRKIPPGDAWETAIDERLAQADIILLMIGPAFIASEYCYKRELPAALARREAADVVPIVVDSVDWTGLPFDVLQMPRQGKPITESRNRNSAWTEVVRALPPTDCQASNRGDAATS